MTVDLQQLQIVREADVYKNGVLAGHLARTTKVGVSFSYREPYVGEGGAAVAFSLSTSSAAMETSNGALRAGGTC